MTSRPRPARPALSLVEVVICVAITGGLLAASLSGVGALARARAVADERDTAGLLAGEMIAELTARAYEDPDSASRVFGPEAGETAGPGRTLFDDVDDYHGLQETDITYRDGSDRGVPGWFRTVEIAWAWSFSPDQDAGFDTRLKRCTVTVGRGDKTVLRISALRAAARDSGVR